MSEHTPITGELRGAMERYCNFKDENIVKLTEGDFDRICDAIDAVHAALERENAELRQRVAELDKRDDSMHIGGSITDELRRFIEDPLLGYVPQEQHIKILTEIADRIDVEHDREMIEIRTRGWSNGYDEGFASADDWLAQHEDAMAEHGWVRMPVDADGVPFHISELVDEMLPFGGYAAPAPIDTMELYRGASGYDWMVKLDAENRASISPQLLRHHHEPTVEDVLREMHAELDEVTALYVGEAIDSDERDRDEARIFAEYAKRLTLAGDAE